MTQREEIKLEVLEEILESTKNMYDEYITDYIREQISIIKHGI